MDIKKCWHVPGQQVSGRQVDMYTLIYINGYLPSCRQGLSCIKACIYIYLYGYTNGLAGIMAAVGQADMYTLTYIYGYLPIRRLTSHPEYTYRAYHLY